MVQAPISPIQQVAQDETPPVKKVSRLEGIKERSQFLREPVATELAQDTTHFTEEGIQILKFHGSYQQDNRDNRIKGQEKDYRMMLRTRNPGGLVSPELYLTWMSCRISMAMAISAPLRVKRFSSMAFSRKISRPPWRRLFAVWDRR